MNRKTITVALSLLLAAGSALADGKTRAEVRAETVQARTAGLLDVTEANYPVVPASTSTLTREQVRAEVVAARAAGALDLNEANYPREYANLPSPRVEARTLQASAKAVSAQR